MSRENVIRRPLSVPTRSARTLDERVLLRFPTLVRALGRWALRRPARSRLRQALLSRAAAQGFAAVNRRDFEAVLPKYHPDVEIQVHPEFLRLGDMEPIYRGREGYLQYYRDWLPAWGDGFWFEPRELIDLGDGRLMALVQASVRGQESEIQFERQVAFLWTLDQEAAVLREQLFTDWDEALQAVGLRE